VLLDITTLDSRPCAYSNSMISHPKPHRTSAQHTHRKQAVGPIQPQPSTGDAPNPKNSKRHAAAHRRAQTYTLRLGLVRAISLLSTRCAEPRRAQGGLKWLFDQSAAHSALRPRTRDLDTCFSSTMGNRRKSMLKNRRAYLVMWPSAIGGLMAGNTTHRMDPQRDATRARQSRHTHQS